MKPKYGLVTYATIPKVWVKVRDGNSSNADWVTRILDQISYEGQRSGKGLVGGGYFGVREVKRCRVVVGRGVVETTWEGKADHFAVCGRTAGSLLGNMGHWGPVEG